MAKLFEDENYASSDDEDYVPTASENTKADQEFASLQKQGKKESDNEQEPEEELPDEMFSFLNEGGEENEATSDDKQEDSNDKEESNDDFVGKVQEFPGDITATTIVPGLQYKVKTVSDFYGQVVEEEKEMSKEELDDLVAKSATNASRKRKAVKVDGLDVALKSLEKKKKISLIDKTDLDWKSHVQKKGIETTLSSFEKSRKNVVDHLNFTKKSGQR